MMNLNEKKILQKSAEIHPVKRMLEDVVGCKWSISVLSLIRQGINRPGAMERKIDGLTTKVLNERLRKLVNYQIIEREVFAEVPPHVEYHLTAFGEKFIGILDAIQTLENEFEGNTD